MATNKRTLSRIGFYCGLALFLIITLLWGSDQFWAELVQPGRTCKPCVARGVVI